MAVAPIQNSPRDISPSTSITQQFKNPLTGRGGVHPVQRRMKIVQMKGAIDAPFFDPAKESTLDCHYNPESVTKTLGAEYVDVPIPGLGMKNIMFMFGEPRKWSMELLFNSWGDDEDQRSANWISVEDSIEWLESRMLPTNSSGKIHANWLGKVPDKSAGDPTGFPPPLLGIFLTRSVITAYLTHMELTMKKLDPDTLELVRASVRVEFTESLPSNI